MAKKKFDYQSVAGDYQYRALHHGLPMQRFWHKGKLIFWDEVIASIFQKTETADPIVEIGCGAGLLLQHLATRPQVKMGVDVNFQALSFLTGRFQEMGRQSSFFAICADGQGLPFIDNCFGGLILSEVLEHLLEPRLIMEEAYRVVKPGGWCYITTPNYYSFWPWMEKILDRLKLTPPIAGAQHVSTFNLQNLRDLVGKWKVELLKSFYKSSPFFAIFSEKQAVHSLIQESHSDLQDGMIIACLLRKPD